MPGMAAGYTNTATGMTGKSDHPARWRAGWIGLKHSADLLMGPRSARCSVFKDRCASAAGLAALHAWGSHRAAPEGRGSIALRRTFA